MNAVEIEQAVSELVEAPFDRDAFPFAFLEAFGNKATTIAKLKIDRDKKGSTNQSDLEGGVLQRNNIHLVVCDEGKVTESLKAAIESPETGKRKAKYALATDGKTIEAENLVEGETLACDFSELADHFGFFLPLAGITTVKEIRNNAFDIKATSRLNRLYVELLRHNPEWDTAERREEMNHFFARLIFCFFAEDTGIFKGKNLFTTTVEQLSDGTNTHEILTELFRAMNTSPESRKAADLANYSTKFPYVNGGLFSGSPEVPEFTKIARSYLLHVGHLDWTQINPDIFGSMIQAVADDEERGALGMHYTSVPNILKVLNPLFLDELREKLDEAGDNKRKLLNLRNRMARIRVFDPACGSGNFLVIAYKEMREIEARINQLRGEVDRRSEIPLTNFRGIELRHFSAEIARLALIIAEYQCDVLYRGQKLALLEFLPLDAENWITCGNALRLDWLKICPPTGTRVKVTADDLFSTPLEQAEMDFENEGGETYICGNPPYLGNKLQSAEQKVDLGNVFDGRCASWKSLDYVAGWFMKAADYGLHGKCVSAFVATNSLCQGQQVSILWPQIFATGHNICFAHTSFTWANLASNNAGVIVIIVGISRGSESRRSLYYCNEDGSSSERSCKGISPYLIEGSNVVVDSRRSPSPGTSTMMFGNMPRDGGGLILTPEEAVTVKRDDKEGYQFVRRFVGSEDFIRGQARYCLWIDDLQKDEAVESPFIHHRLVQVKQMRLASKAKSTQNFAQAPHRFVQIQGFAKRHSLIIPRHSSERRQYLPVGLLKGDSIVADSAFAIYDGPIWEFGLLVSRIHLVWIASVCGKLKLDYRYSNTLGWNTFPRPILTQEIQQRLESSSRDILLARESYYPCSIAEMYNPDSMKSLFPNLLEAHQRNDEVIERAYIGRRFKNDTERLEKLFSLFEGSEKKQ